jgi:hypothetical protein
MSKCLALKLSWLRFNNSVLRRSRRIYHLFSLHRISFLTCQRLSFLSFESSSSSNSSSFAIIFISCLRSHEDDDAIRDRLRIARWLVFYKMRKMILNSREKDAKTISFLIASMTRWHSAFLLNLMNRNLIDLKSIVISSVLERATFFFFFFRSSHYRLNLRNRHSCSIRNDVHSSDNRWKYLARFILRIMIVW